MYQVEEVADRGNLGNVIVWVEDRSKKATQKETKAAIEKNNELAVGPQKMSQ